MASAKKTLNPLTDTPSNKVEITKPFMLASLTDRGFAVATEIKANVPYILAMPNSEAYDIGQNIKGNITFESSSVTVAPTLELQVSVGPEFDLVPAYEMKERDFSVYALNDMTYNDMLPGSAFVSGLRDVQPFEVWASVESKSASSKS